MINEWDYSIKDSAGRLGEDGGVVGGRLFFPWLLEVGGLDS